MGRNVPKPQNKASLDNTAKQINETASNLVAVGMLMETENVDVLSIRNHDQMLRAMKYLDNYLAAARDALRTAKQKRGDFIAVGVPESAPQRPGKSRLKAPKRTRFSGGSSGIDGAQGNKQ